MVIRNIHRHLSLGLSLLPQHLRVENKVESICRSSFQKRERRTNAEMHNNLSGR